MPDTRPPRLSRRFRCRSILLVAWALLTHGATAWAETMAQRAERLLGQPCRAQPVDWVDDSVAAWEAEQDRDYVTAILSQKRIVSNMCDRALPWIELAELHVRAGRLPAALSHLEYALDLDPELVLQRFVGTGGLRSLHFEPLLVSGAYRDSELFQRIDRLLAPSRRRRALARALLERLPAEKLPPDPFVARPRCPGEMCGFGSWEVYADTPLVAAPESDRVVGHARKDTSVQALTGETRIHAPAPVLVVHEVRVALDPFGPDRREVAVQPGEILFLLDYHAEGSMGVWYDGRYARAKVGDYVRDACAQPAWSCWGEYIDHRGTDDWWFQVRLADGTEGWTNRADNFLTLSDEAQRRALGQRD